MSFTGILSGQPPALSASVVVTNQPVLIPANNGGNLDVDVVTLTGYSYQFQSTTNLTSPVWISEGAAFAGMGELVKKTISNVSPEKFFRVGVTVQ